MALGIGVHAVIADEIFHVRMLQEGAAADCQVSGQTVAVEPLPNGQWLIRLEKLQEHELVLCYNNPV